MDKLNKVKEEIFEINNKKFAVITRVSKENLGKDKLIKLIAGYAMQELKQEDL